MNQIVSNNMYVLYCHESHQEAGVLNYGTCREHGWLASRRLLLTCTAPATKCEFMGQPRGP